MEKSKLQRINELYAKSQKDGLNADELEEQAILRREYIESYKKSLVSQLENTYVVDDKGNKKKVTKKGK